MRKGCNPKIPQAKELRVGNVLPGSSKSALTQTPGGEFAATCEVARAPRRCPGPRRAAADGAVGSADTAASTLAEPTEWATLLAPIQRYSEMEQVYHYPADLLELLVDTIGRLSRSKKGVLLFFQGAAVPAADLAAMTERVNAAPDSISRFEIARDVLVKLNARGDSGLGPRRALLKRVVEFNRFEACWPKEQLEASGLVARVRDLINERDAFTRMKQERDTEQAQRRAQTEAQRTNAANKLKRIEDVDARLGRLFGMDDAAHQRGKLLEAVLNDLFRAYDILVREDFRRRDGDTPLVLEQIDGVIEFGSNIFLVEMKWLKDPVGIAEFHPHLARLFLRANVAGLFISSSGFTEPVLRTCQEALSQKTMILCSLQEVVLLLQRRADLVDFLRAKYQSAVVDKRPFLEIVH